MDRRKDILDTIECCRDENIKCEDCPLQGEICDELYVEMISLPAGLVDMIEEAMAEQ